MTSQNSYISNKFILNFTPTGMIPTKKMTPHVPVLPKEIIAHVIDAISLGANMIHLHARDSQTGLPTYKKEIYARIIAGIKEHNSDVIIGVSTSGRTCTDFDKGRTRLATNRELISRVVDIGRVLDTKPYSCHEAREVLRLK